MPSEPQMTGASSSSSEAPSGSDPDPDPRDRCALAILRPTSLSVGMSSAPSKSPAHVTTWYVLSGSNL